IDSLHALIEATFLIESVTDLNELAESIVKTAAELLGTRYGALGIVGTDGVTLSRFVTYGITPEQRDLLGNDPTGRGILGEIIQGGTSVRIADMSKHAGAVGFPPNHPVMTTFLGVPIRTSDGQIFGAIYICDRLDKALFDEDDEDLLDAFGLATGYVIDQATLRARSRDLVLSEERERLARDLHDSVVQRLFGIGLSLQVLRRSDLIDKDLDRITSALKEIDAAMLEVRTTIFEIENDHLRSAVLKTRVTDLANEVEQRLGVPVVLSISDGVESSMDVFTSDQLISSLREILSNVVRHSHASFVSVALSVNTEFVVLEVKDDGIGFTGPSSVGHGLRNLATRARQCGGTFSASSTPESGTIIIWTTKKVEK
ncbi:MAG: GAF domain-containing protein, partial [Acidimicrobiaceae bacterium]